MIQVVNYTYFLPLEGQVETTSFTWSNPDFPPQRLAWCCPVCGEVWARAVPDNDSRWIFMNAPCRKHKWYSSVPGGMLVKDVSKKKNSSMFWAAVLEHLPDDLVKRELTMTLNYYESVL